MVKQMWWGLALSLAVAYAQLPFSTNATYNATGNISLADGTGWDFPMTYSGDTSGSSEVVISDLLAQVRYVSSDIVRVRIIDSTNPRWEVPDVVNITSYYNGTLNYAVNYTLAPFNLNITRNSDGAVIFNLNQTLQYDDQDIILTNNLGTAKAFYGIGERVTPYFQLTVGGVYTTFNKDATPIDNGDNDAGNMYGTHPFYLAVDNTTMSALGGFLLNSNAMDTYIDQEFIQFRTIGGVIDHFSFIGPTFQDVFQQYHSLIGQPALVPYWGLGWHQCRWGYTNTSALEAVLGNYTANGLPLDVLWSDIDYMDSYADFTYDPVNFAGLPQFVQGLHSLQKHYVPIVDAGIANTTYFGYVNGSEMNVFLQSPYAGNGTFIGQVWPGAAVYIDWSHPNASTYWQSMIAYLQSEIHYDGLWLDMNEASNFCDGECTPLTPLFNSTDLPYLPGNVDLNIKNIDLDVLHYNKFTEYDFHSLYGFYESLATSRYLQSTLGVRPFIISRSTFAGNGRFAQHWLGDNTSDWPFLEYSIIGIYNFQMYGIPFVGADICGFNGNTTAELCSRWMQLGTLYPFARNHNSFNTIAQEPYALGNVTLVTSQFSIRLRYYLLNYFYTLLFKHSQDGGVWFKPAFFEYPDDRELFEVHVSDNFMLGSSIIVHPVLTPSTTSIYAYFPDDTWYNLFSGQLLDLSVSQYITLNVTLPSPIPIHVRGGSIIPTLDSYDTVLNVVDLRASNTTLIVALNSSGGASGSLVIDDGEDTDSLTGGYYTELYFEYFAFGTVQDVLKVTPISANYELLPNEFPNISTLEIFGCYRSPLQVSLYGGTTVRSLLASVPNYDASLGLCRIKFLEPVATAAFGVFYISYA